MTDLHFEAPSEHFSADFTLSEDHIFMFDQILDTREHPAADFAREDQANRDALEEDDVPRIGNRSARNTVVIFADFQCPFCKDAARLLEKQLLPDAKDQLAIVFRQFPLAIPGHTWARHAADATACIYRQNKDAFWPVHDYLFEHQGTITAGALDSILNAQFKLIAPTVNEHEYSECMAKGLGAAIVSRDIGVASQLKLSATPTFFINGRRIDGLPPIDQFRAMLSDTAIQ